MLIKDKTEKVKTVKNEDGFSLLEVLLAVAIFSIGMLALSAMQISSIQGNDLAMDSTQAIILASDRLERIRAMDFDTIDDGSDTQGDYSISWVVTLMDSNNDGETNDDDTYKKVKVTVKHEPSGKTIWLQHFVGESYELYDR